MPPALLDGASVAIGRRARVARVGAIRFEPGAPPIAIEPAPAGEAEELGAPAIVGAEVAARVQLRIDADAARLLVWIDRADLARVFVKAQALVDPRTGVRGAVARRGAIARVEDDGERGVDVEVDDGVLSAAGRAPSGSIGTVYDERPPRRTSTETVVASDEVVRAAPDGPPVARTAGAVMVHVLGPPQSGWLEIEIDRPYLYVRGFVRETATAPQLSVGDVVGASSYEMDDLPTLLLPAGACLYARPGGPIIGVNEAERLRYVRDGGAPGWRRVGVMTAWGLVWPAAHFPEAHGQPTGDFDRCPMRPASRAR
jgi:hypothetical protein